MKDNKVLHDLMILSLKLNLLWSKRSIKPVCIQCKSELFDHLKKNCSEAIHVDYSLSSCGRSSMEHGCQASRVIVESQDGSSRFKLPTVIECN